MSPVIGFYLLVAMTEVVVRAWSKATKRPSDPSMTLSTHITSWAFTLVVPFGIQWLVPGRQSSLGLFLWWAGSFAVIGFCLGVIQAIRGLR